MVWLLSPALIHLFPTTPIDSSQTPCGNSRSYSVVWVHVLQPTGKGTPLAVFVPTYVARYKQVPLEEASIDTGTEAHARTHTHTYTRAHVHTFTHMHSHTHTHALTCAHTHACMHTHTYTHAHVHTHLYSHVYTRTCTHTHTLLTVKDLK